MKLPFKIRIERPAESQTAAPAPGEETLLDPEILKDMNRKALENLTNKYKGLIEETEDPNALRTYRVNLWHVEATLRVPEKKRKGMNPAELRNLEVVAKARSALSPAQSIRTGWPWWIRFWHLWLVLLVLGFLASVGAAPGTYLVVIVPYAIGLWAVGRQPTPSARPQPTNTGAAAEATPATVTRPIRSGLSGCVVLLIKAVGGFLVLLFILAALAAGVSQENLCGGLILPAMILIPLIVWRYFSIPVIPVESADKSPIVLPKATPLNLGWPPVHELSRDRKIGRLMYLLTSMIIYYPEDFKIVHYWGIGNFFPRLFATDYDTIILKSTALAIDADARVLSGQLELHCELEGGGLGTVCISCRRQGWRKLVGHGLKAPTHRIVARIEKDTG